MPTDPTLLLRPAIERGLLCSPVTLTALAGNADRRDEQQRSHFKLTDHLGRRLKLTIGRNLEEIRKCADLFHAALPHHSSATVFFLATEKGDLWAQEWIDGPSLKSEISSAAEASEIIWALETIERGLQSTASASTSDAWNDEFRAWSRSIAHLSVWTTGETADLALVLPRLGALLRPTAPQKRWSNGDFISSNIHVNAEGDPVLVDFEHGGTTHFSPEDRVRFLRLSPIARHHPGLFAGIWPHVAKTTAWDVFFQLRQLSLELSGNSPAYLERHLPTRKSLIRFAAENIGLNLPNWSAPSRSPAPAQSEETVQLFWHGTAGWSEDHSCRVQVARGRPQFVAFRVPTGARHLRLDPVASIRPVHLKSIVASSERAELYDALGGSAIIGAKIEKSSLDGLRLLPTHADPQVMINLISPATFLIAEIFVDEAG